MATHAVDGAVHLEHVVVAGECVVAVDVLRDDRELLRHADFFQPGDRQMSRVWAPVVDQRLQLQQPAPDTPRIAQEALDAGHLVGVDVVPETGGAVAEGRDAAVGGQAGTGKDDDPACRLQHRCD
ncbi:MAG: hypothetical protein AW07_02887 [Candidatus Accumulibacter sp. SK-11]|nr:MAG: hypothetical protein AW07_02887 [Candidatus Accumulibacter sp. SK-11]